MAYRLLGKNILLTWFKFKLNPPLKDNCQNHGLNGLWDFADWDLREVIAKLKYFVTYLTNNPPKSSLENGGL
jgi:hypothetical protein